MILEKKIKYWKYQSNIQIKFGKILIFQHYLDILINKYKSGVPRNKHGNHECRDGIYCKRLDKTDNIMCKKGRVRELNLGTKIYGGKDCKKNKTQQRTKCQKNGLRE